MNNKNSIQVYFEDSLVGYLSEDEEHLYFGYSEEWLETGFSISPFKLPLKNGVFVWKREYPDVFRKIPFFVKNLFCNLKQTIDIKISDAMTNFGFSALYFKPALLHENKIENKINEIYKSYIYTDNINNLDNIFNKNLNFEFNHRRFTILLINGENWIVKSSYPDKDTFNIGYEEYKYYQCAKICGINIPEFKLFNSKICPGYIGTKFFDNINGKKLHSIDLDTLLQIDKRTKLDLIDIINQTYLLTKNKEDIKEIYRRMCFYFFSECRDCNLSNWKYLYKDNNWELAPAFDFEYRDTEALYEVSINGNRINPDINDLLSVASQFGLDIVWAKETALNIKSKCYKLLKNLGYLY